MNCARHNVQGTIPPAKSDRINVLDSLFLDLSPQVNMTLEKSKGPWIRLAPRSNEKGMPFITRSSR